VPQYGKLFANTGAGDRFQATVLVLSDSLGRDFSQCTNKKREKVLVESIHLPPERLLADV